MLDTCFLEQRDFILDKCRRKSARCPRRSGKSYSTLVMMCRTALLRAGANIIYLCLTRGQAKSNLWKLAKDFNDRFELGLKFHETNLTMTFPNGSVIGFYGAETRQEIEKLRGQKFDLVVIDEGKSFQHEILEEAIHEIITPALADNLGTLAMIGTPGNILAGPFYEATSEHRLTRPYKDRANWTGKFYWSFHSWHVAQNTAMPHIWEAALEEKEALDIPDSDPAWRREWLGEWCPSESLMVYEYSEDKNAYDGKLPDGHEWQYLLGLDLGYNDSTAIVVTAFSDTHDTCYQVYDWKESSLTVDGIERNVRRVMAMFPSINAMIADTGGLGKTIVESLQDHGLAFEAAQKRDKHDHIMLVNSDLRHGKIKLLRDGHLAAEMKQLQWTDKTYRKEHTGVDNHCCDAHLYLIRFAYHHFWERKLEKPQFGTEAWIEEWEREQEEQAAADWYARHTDTADQLDDVDDWFINSLDGGPYRWN